MTGTRRDVSVDGFNALPEAEATRRPGPARAVRTPLIARLEASGVEPPDYPLPRAFLTEPPFLAGQGGPLARALPAGELVTLLEQETSAASSKCRPRTRAREMG